MNKIIACLFFFLVYCVQDLSSQSRFHIELDCHYIFGLSERGEFANFSRNEYKMYGNSLHLSGNYKFSDAWSAGIGIGADRFENPGYNTFPNVLEIVYPNGVKEHIPAGVDLNRFRS